MGLLDGVFDDLFVAGRTGRKLARLAEEGELVPATIARHLDGRSRSTGRPR